MGCMCSQEKLIKSVNDEDYYLEGLNVNNVLMSKIIFDNSNYVSKVENNISNNIFKSENKSKVF